VATAPPIEIRRERYGSAVARTLTDALEAELRERYDGQGGSGSEPPPEDFEPPDGAFLVAYVGDEPAACGGLCRFDDARGEIRRMYVVPAHRGWGMSATILAELEAEARRLAYTLIRLETGDRQPEAIALYASAGYHPIRCYRPYPDDPRSRCFEKRL
jgi:GNAT superfamily N-acetyltransferase